LDEPDQETRLRTNVRCRVALFKQLAVFGELFVAEKHIDAIDRPVVATADDAFFDLVGREVEIAERVLTCEQLKGEIFR